MFIYKNGLVIAEIDSPYDLDEWAFTYAIPIEELTLDINEVKPWKINELRDKADAWYKVNIRSFDGEVIALKMAAGQTLTTEETQYYDTILSADQIKQNLVTQARQATTVTDLINIYWVDPEVL